jgi:N-acetylglucosaminyl-diphospho-decaprenol L-rhamnosyltransferase
MRPASLVVVNYKTASLAIDAIRSARAASSSPLQVIVVDNSTDATEADVLRPHADRLIAPERNLGYAAAINLARPHCAAEVMIVANPDVVFAAESIDRLLVADADVAGPSLFWDESYEWHLPPSELHTAAQVLDRAAASRSPAWSRRRDRRRVRDRIAFWRLREPTRVASLSGAVLAIRAAAFDAAGGFDERFHLYFEENDFLRRVRGKIVYVPSSRCRHIYNQSAASSPASTTAYASSERAYHEKWHGRRLAGALKRLEKPLPAPMAIPVDAEPIAVPPSCWVEASPLASFDTAAGYEPRSHGVQLPDSIWGAYRGSALYLRIVDGATGATSAVYARSKIAE